MSCEGIDKEVHMQFKLCLKTKGCMYTSPVYNMLNCYVSSNLHFTCNDNKTCILTFKKVKVKKYSLCCGAGDDKQNKISEWALSQARKFTTYAQNYNSVIYTGQA